MPATCLAWFFFFNDTATTEIYTLSLHDALPISAFSRLWSPGCGMSITTLLPSTRSTPVARRGPTLVTHRRVSTDRKSTRLNSSHLVISYAVFCLKKKKNHCADA